MALSKAPPADTPFLPKDTFKNDVILITGGGTGIGKGLATEFARLGGTIVIASRGAEHRASGVKAIEAMGGKAVDVELNIRDAAAVKAAFDEAEEKAGPVSILINNAAANFPTVADELSPNGWHAIVQAVLDGTFFCSTEFARRRVAAGKRGAVLNIGATYGWTGCGGAAPAAAAKAGVMNLTQSLAVEWAPDDIRINTICPGVFPHDDFPAAMKARMLPPDELAKNIPAQRVGEMHEIGWLACYLCSPYAAYITGHNAVIDGANWHRRELSMPLFRPVREWASTKNVREQERAKAAE